MTKMTVLQKGKERFTFVQEYAVQWGFSWGKPAPVVYYVICEQRMTLGCSRSTRYFHDAAQGNKYFKHLTSLGFERQDAKNLHW